MKAKILFAVLLILPVLGYSQNQVKKELAEVNVAAPEFKGIENYNLVLNEKGNGSINDYLKNHTEYPAEAAECNIQGTAVVQFIVTADGKVTDFKVINSICPLIDNEIIRVLKTTDGMWKPGLKDYSPADMEQEVAMMFVAGRANMKSPVEYFTMLAKVHCEKGNVLMHNKNKPKKALNYYNECVKYVPNDAPALLLRGLCRYELGDRDGARSDWERVNRIGTYDADELIQNMCDLTGYNEMVEIINK